MNKGSPEGDGNSLKVKFTVPSSNLNKGSLEGDGNKYMLLNLSTAAFE